MVNLIQFISIFYLAQKVQVRRRSNFSDELMLPPLKPINGNTSKYTKAVPVLYTNDPPSISRWIEKHISERPCLVGWDVESSPNLPWRETSYVGPATIQVATVNAVIVVEIANERVGVCLNNLVPLKELLADPLVLKAGVGIDQDMLELYRLDEGLLRDVFGRLDIGGIGSSMGRQVSLKSLTRVILGLDLPKSRRMAMSDWAKSPLSDNQIIYAACDAWVSAAVMEELYHKDPEIFSLSSILNIRRDRGEEQAMEVMHIRATQRKDTKAQLLEIIKTGDEKIARDDLTKEQLKKVELLEEKIKDLAPTWPITFDIKQYGLSMWN